MTRVKDSNAEHEVVVIGGGIVGAAIAEQLQSRGHRVFLVDRDTPGNGCSYGNAGHFATDVVFPLANMQTILALPKMLADPLGPLSIRWQYLPKMLPWLMRFALAALPGNVRRSCDNLRALNSRSIDSYNRLLTRLELQDLMTRKGALTIYESQQSEKKNRATVEQLRGFGVEIESLDRAEIRDLEPALGENIAGGLFFPKTAHTVNPFRLVQSLVSRFCDQGGVFLQQNVTDAHTLSDGTTRVVLADGSALRAQKVILAAGAWSRPLARQLGFSVPLDTERGYHLMLPEPGCTLSRPMVSFERSFVMTPMEEGVRLAGTVELAGLEAPADNRRADILFQHAQSILPGLQSQGAQRWMGFRPSLPDSLPVIGASPKNPNQLFAFGHQHLGLTQAAITAELLADQLEGKRPELDLTPFSITRF
ncbi:NAD(P)/FAD-dependent oxidoreductase [Microbulbifer sp. MCCC 1A16149]|uniref:NAD(P)/FAD-dependent oxidoreductase n=1 Tax=Microbulbifer sp. MCCC 1A16149 TaxID=3411322 RepID=UPI003D0ADAD3